MFFVIQRMRCQNVFSLIRPKQVGVGWAGYIRNPGTGVNCFVEESFEKCISDPIRDISIFPFCLMALHFPPQ
jgi:hypothetical protein